MQKLWWLSAFGLNKMESDRKLVFALRHSPEAFGLKPDAEGWVDLQSFLVAMGISKKQLDDIVAKQNKKRLEVQGDKIRVSYGHSSKAGKIQYPEAQPPSFLFHGTSPFTAFVIKKEGLKPMNRQYVHLSSTPETAAIVGKRKDVEPIILTIDAQKAFEGGVKFYHPNEDIWLSDHIPPSYIKVPNEQRTS